MSDERDDLLKEIGDALRVEPSPSFAAGVRTKIAAEVAPRGRWAAWLVWGGAGSAVAAAIVIAVVLRPAAVTTPMSEPPATALAPQAPAPAVTAASSMPASPRRIAAVPVSRPVSATAVSVVILPTDERAGLDVLLKRLRAGPIFLPTVESGIDPVSGELLPLPKVEIPPIVADDESSARNRAGRPR